MASCQSTFAYHLTTKSIDVQKKFLLIGFVLLMASTLHLKAQYAKTDSTYKHWFIGSTMFLLGNFDKTNPPSFAQLNFGYALQEKM